MAPLENRLVLFGMHAFFAFTSRLWDMGIALLVAHITDNNIAIVALNGLLSNIAILFLMGHIGALLDRTDRLRAAYTVVAVKLAAVSLAYLCGAILSEEFRPNAGPSPAIYLIPCFGAVASLAFSTITQQVEKDWVVILSEKSSSWLTSTNSVMSQIDLACASFAPPIAGFIFTSFSLVNSALILFVTNVLSAISLAAMLARLYYTNPALSVRDDHLSTSDASANRLLARDAQRTDFQAMPSPSSSSVAIAEGDIELSRVSAVSHSYTSPTSSSNPKSFWWRWIIVPLSLEEFASCGCALVLVGYAFLYCTCLSFGSIMTVFLRFEGMNDATIGAFRGANALMGLCGATAFPSLVALVGLWTASQAAIAYQFVMIFIATASLFVERGKYAMYLLATCVLLSRTGLWMFDLGVRQIAQETIPEQCRGKVNGQWKSLTAGFEMMSYLCAMALPDANDFDLLAVLSVAMVFSGLAVFTYAHRLHVLSMKSTYQYISLE